jgi:hypothetical protein
MGVATMIIMETGSCWPVWLDREGAPSPSSSIERISQRPGENSRQFAQRAVHRLLELDQAPLTSILVCNAEASGERMTWRGVLLRALVRRAQNDGRGHVVLAADGDYGQRCELLRLAARLNEEVQEDDGVAVRFRALAREASPSRQIRQVA